MARPFGRGPTTRSLWLLTIQKSWDDLPRISELGVSVRRRWCLEGSKEIRPTWPKLRIPNNLDVKKWWFFGLGRFPSSTAIFWVWKNTTCVCWDWLRIWGVGKWWCWTKWPERQVESVRDKGGNVERFIMQIKGAHPPNATEVAGLIYGMIDHHHSLVRRPTKY